MRLILLLSIIIQTQICIGQQAPTYSQYTLNPFTINPAVASTEDYVDIQTGYRSQWTSFEGGPKTLYLSGHATINKPFYQHHYKAEHKNWHGVGAQLFQDKIGPLQQQSFLLAYAYNLAITKKTRLSLGTFVGIKQFKTNSAYWKHIQDPSDELFLQDLNSGLQPELQFGAVMYRPQNYSIQFSIQNMLVNPIDFDENSSTLTNQYPLHTYLSFKKYFPLSLQLVFIPSTLIKMTPNAPISVDVNTQVIYKKAYWFGLSLRSTRAFNIMAGLNLKKYVDISFAYEYDTNDLSQFNNGTYELIIGLRLAHPKTILDPSKFW